MKTAIILLNTRQYFVSEGSVLKVDRIPSRADVKVLFYSDGSSVECGEPFLDDAKVSFDILGNELDKKVVVGRFKAKSRYRKLGGHRQPISVIKIKDISKKGSVRRGKKNGA